MDAFSCLHFAIFSYNNEMTLDRLPIIAFFKSSQEVFVISCKFCSKIVFDFQKSITYQVILYAHISTLISFRLYEKYNVKLSDNESQRIGNLQETIVS